MPTIKFDPKGPDVVFEVFFGEKQLGLYSASLHDSKGNLIEGSKMEGNNIDAAPDIYKLPIDPSDLNSKVILWAITIAAPEDEPGEEYFVRLSFKQNGDDLPGSPVVKKGKLAGEKIVIGRGRFAARA